MEKPLEYLSLVTDKINVLKIYDIRNKPMNRKLKRSFIGTNPEKHLDSHFLNNGFV